MQIKNDLHSYTGADYTKSHTHHITKCLHEEEEKKQTAGAAGIRNKALEAGAAEEKKSTDIFYERGNRVYREKENSGKRPGFVRAFWESLGEEKGRDGAEEPADKGKGRQETGLAGISAVSAAIRRIIPSSVIARIETAGEKIKVGIGTALKRFGKRQDAFGALSDPGNHFTGKGKGKEGGSERAGRGSVRTSRPEILTATMSDTYLMDSYSKTGEYCRLNENLLYRKNTEDKKVD